VLRLARGVVRGWPVCIPRVRGSCNKRAAVDDRGGIVLVPVSLAECTWKVVSQSFRAVGMRLRSGNRDPAMELRHGRHQAQHVLPPEASRSSYKKTASGTEANARH
jgi:hypothetical protein